MISLILTIFCSFCQVPENKEVQRVWTEEERFQLIEGLEDTRHAIILAVAPFSEEQWITPVDSGGWSPAQILEHLIQQQTMHFREVYVLSKTPEMPKYAARVKNNDDLVRAYENDATRGTADWLVTPRGRWCGDKRSAIDQFNLINDQTVNFVRNTGVDLRLHFTFRDIPDSTDFRRVRDLHQILLTTIAHNKRHLKVIESANSADD